jgi:thiamine biosynthesis lipoprotein
MPYAVIVGKQLTQKERLLVSTTIDQTLQEIDLLFNEKNPESEISKLNSAPALTPFPLSEKLASALALCSQVQELSGGRFDPTIEPLREVWEKALENKRAPEPARLQAACDAIGWERLSFSGKSCTKKTAAAKLNLSAVSRGIFVDWMIERLKALGFLDLFVEWSGEIRASGRHPDGTIWSVPINPALTSGGKPMPPIVLDNKALSTSGEKVRSSWCLGPKASPDGEAHRYFNIIDPLTAQPIELTFYSIASSVVIAPSCALADALATAAMLFNSRKEAESWAQEVVELHPEVSFWIISHKK